MYIHVTSVYTHTYIQINLFSKNLYIVPIDYKIVRFFNVKYDISNKE